MLNIYIVRQSIYWITGSFNYVYPLFMLLWYWYTLLNLANNNYKCKNLLLTSLLAFFASATVEQASMMSFGITVLFFFYNLIKNKNFNFKKFSIILICSLIGVISVILAPSQMIRFCLETSENFLLEDSFKNNIRFFVDMFILREFYRPQVILVLFTIFLSIITIKKSNKQSIKYFNLFSAFILGVGSQIMMFISPVYGERNTLFAGIMIILFSAILVSHLPEIKNKILIHLESTIYFLLISTAVINIFNIYKNYKTTNIVQNRNIGIINEYKLLNSNTTLELYKPIDDRFGWSMPHVSSYHEYWFKIYYEIPNSSIVWKEY